ncbi:MAG: hypothetical protein GF419_12740, partial [Ignavibacteriales bacterium]|nr:hypothetical protein [Ignavibacteriales bacterium]
HESVEKAFRTFSKNVERLDRYEDFVYLQSSPQFYEWMERHRPEVFENIRRLVEAGKWEPVGGMWIESDAVLPTGEALARQRLLGQRYYLAKFGALSKVAWFPDTFGAGANLPQIFLKSGSPYYFTAKLGWNYENEFPVYHFRWRAPDGSEVIGLNSPIELGWSPGPYEWLKDSMRTRSVLAKPGKEIVLSSAAPAIPEAARAEETIPEILQIFGEGDGGEGPTDKMIQRGAYLAMTPDYQFGRASDYFAEIERRYGDRLPVWEDEIYLENHRGVSSSERRVKKLNRLAEPALIAAERWGAIASEVAGYEFPKEEWRRAWKILLFNDFHDILPGTSIPQVFVDAERDYDELLRIAERIRDDALSAIAANVSTLPPEEERDGAAFGEGAPLILFNPLPWDRDEYVRVEWGFPWTRVIDDNGEEIPSQTVFRDGENILIYKARVPALGYATYRLLGKSEPDEDWTPMIDGSTVSNDYYRLTLDPETGDLASWYDERIGAPLLKAPAAGVRYFHNYPKEFSNWNVDPDYDSKEIVPLPDERRRVTILDDGPVFAAIAVVSPAPNGGELRREYRFYRESPRVEVSMDLDVFYRESIVKAELPFAVGADEVVAETPFYAQPHPVNPRTSFEKAKIELRAQKWLDMSGKDYGVTALLTATSGFDVKDGRLRLTLVKGGANPNPNTDVGSHRVEYAMEPHPGDWKTADAWKRGYEYHYPIVPRLEPQHEGTFPARKSFGGTAGGTASDHVCWEALKPSEDGDDLVVRVYEAEGRAAERVELRLPFVVAKAAETDLLEIETIGDVAADGDSIVFEIEPYEILTIKITPAR